MVQMHYIPGVIVAGHTPLSRLVSCHYQINILCGIPQTQTSIGENKQLSEPDGLNISREKNLFICV